MLGYLLLGLGDHGSRDVAGENDGAFLGERDGEGACPAAGVADSEALKGALVLEHLEDVLHRLGVAEPDVELDAVHVVGLAVDLLPPLEARAVEVLPHHFLVVSPDLLRLHLPPPVRVRQRQHRCQCRHRAPAYHRYRRPIHRGEVGRRGPDGEGPRPGLTRLRPDNAGAQCGRCRGSMARLQPNGQGGGGGGQ